MSLLLLKIGIRSFQLVDVAFVESGAFTFDRPRRRTKTFHFISYRLPEFALRCCYYCGANRALNTNPSICDEFESYYEKIIAQFY